MGRIRLKLPPFGDYEFETPHTGASLIMPILLPRDAMYELEFGWTSRNVDTGCLTGHLSAISCLMPPITPESDALVLGDKARLPMMDKHGYSVSAEAAQRRTEWAARGVYY